MRQIEQYTYNNLGSGNCMTSKILHLVNFPLNLGLLHEGRIESNCLEAARDSPSCQGSACPRSLSSVPADRAEFVGQSRE